MIVVTLFAEFPRKLVTTALNTIAIPAKLSTVYYGSVKYFRFA